MTKLEVNVRKAATRTVGSYVISQVKATLKSEREALGLIPRVDRERSTVDLHSQIVVHVLPLIPLNCFRSQAKQLCR